MNEKVISRQKVSLKYIRNQIKNDKKHLARMSKELKEFRSLTSQIK